MSKDNDVEWIDIDHNSPDWFMKRCGRINGSKGGVLMANYPLSFTPTAHDYAVQKAVEQITGFPIQSDYGNSHMDRGHEEEPVAVELYERQRESDFVEVGGGGIYICEKDNTATSPDRRVSDNGLIEAKSQIYSSHFNDIKRGSWNPAYKWQYIGQLRSSRSDYLAYISYCSQFPEGQRLYICTILPKDVEEEIEQLDKRIKGFNKLIKQKKEAIQEGTYKTEYVKPEKKEEKILAIVKEHGTPTLLKACKDIIKLANEKEEVL